MAKAKKPAKKKTKRGGAIPGVKIPTRAKGYKTSNKMD